MYKIWTIEDIKKEIYKLEKKSNFFLDKDVGIKINPRLKRTLAYCKYKYVKNLTKLDYMSFSKYLIDGTVNEKEVLNVIIHEFGHIYTDYNKPIDEVRYTDRHTPEWKNNTIMLGGTGEKYYHGNEFTSIRPENITMIARCKRCKTIYNICDIVLGHEVLDYCRCGNKVCNGKLEILKDVSINEKKLKCIKKYIRKQLTNRIKHSETIKLRLSYKNNIFKIQISNKFIKIKNIGYETSINDIKQHLENNKIFKFISNLKTDNIGEDKYEFSFPLDIKNINLAKI